MDNSIFEKALGIISNRRIKAVQEQEWRIREINRIIPQIGEINNQLYNTGKELINIISQANGKNVEEEINRLKEFNVNAQNMARQLLVSGGYPADYLDLHYHCSDCCDTGYSNGEICHCLKKLCGSLSANEMNKNTQLSLSSFDSFSVDYYPVQDRETMSRILNFCKRYAFEFTPKSESILMFGKTGLGKTHLSLAIASVVLEKGYSVVYDSAINILRSIEREHFSREHSSDTIDLVMDTELLILDDLGTEYETQFYSSTIYNIINTRLNRGKPTIISTNLDYAGIRRRYDERVVSRITAVYTCMEFKGEDIRLVIKKNSCT